MKQDKNASSSHPLTGRFGVSSRRGQRSLLLELTPEQLCVLTYTPAERGSAAFTTVPLALAEHSGNYLKAFESAVYDNDFLLEDFGSVSLVVRTSRFVVVPPAFNEEECVELLGGTLGAIAGEAALCRLPESDIAIAYELPSGLRGFVQRTFGEAKMVHHLYPLADTFCRGSMASSSARLYLNLQGKHMDVVAVKEGSLLMANTTHCATLDDAMYFALGTWRTLALEPQNDQLLLTGDNELREAMARQLREYVGYVMPDLYPAEAVKLGTEMMNAPYELAMMALCE